MQTKPTFLSAEIIIWPSGKVKCWRKAASVSREQSPERLFKKFLKTTWVLLKDLNIEEIVFSFLNLGVWIRNKKKEKIFLNFVIFF